MVEITIIVLVSAAWPQILKLESIVDMIRTTDILAETKRGNYK